MKDDEADETLLAAAKPAMNASKKIKALRTEPTIFESDADDRGVGGR